MNQLTNFTNFDRFSGRKNSAVSQPLVTKQRFADGPTKTAN